jgi:hypothetical protein
VALALVTLLVIGMVGCDGLVLVPVPERPRIEYPEYERETPTINLEQVFRQSNWIGARGTGSCVHAAMVSLFRWQGREDLAAMWKANYEDGEWAHKLAIKLDKQGVRYAYTFQKNDVAFLKWAIATRRGCAVAIRKGKHMVTLVEMTSTRVGLLDNNDISRIKWWSRSAFLKEWRNANSWAVTPVYTPPPPLPSKEQIE